MFITCTLVFQFLFFSGSVVSKLYKNFFFFHCSNISKKNKKKGKLLRKLRPSFQLANMCMIKMESKAMYLVCIFTAKDQ